MKKITKKNQNLRVRKKHIRRLLRRRKEKKRVIKRKHQAHLMYACLLSKDVLCRCYSPITDFHHLI